MNIEQLIPVVIPLIAVAVSWGILRSEVSNMRENQRKQEEDLRDIEKECMRKSDCKERHAATEKVMDELRGDVKEIKRLLIDYMGNHRTGG